VKVTIQYFPHYDDDGVLAGAVIVMMASLIFYVIGPESWSLVYVAASLLGLGKEAGWMVRGRGGKAGEGRERRRRRSSSRRSNSSGSDRDK